MTDINNGNTPAQPTPYLDCVNGSGELHCDNQGLTKREHFAALAMQGYLSNPYSNGFTQPLSETPQDDIASLSVAMADALLKELEK